jgi:carboxyl-terminal processing protease
MPSWAKLTTIFCAVTFLAVPGFVAAAASLDEDRVESKVVPGSQYSQTGFYWRHIQPDSALAVISVAAPEAPAARSGLRGGDMIIAIGGQPVGELDGDEIDRALSGEETMTLRLHRNGAEEPLELEVGAEGYIPPAVVYSGMLADKLGYVRLDHLHAGSADQLLKALDGLATKGLDQLVIDLRGNGDGAIEEAVAVADLLLPAERLIVATGRGERLRQYHSRNGSRLAEMPLLVLVDGNTAGPAEIVAGALQDWDRGLLVGQASAGRSSVQRLVDVAGVAQLRLTTAAYKLPSGRYIDRRLRADSTLVEQEVESFTTKIKGRKVYSHAGLEPDIEIDARQTSVLFGQLDGAADGNDRFFSFARGLGLQTGARLGDESLDAFRAAAVADGFDYLSLLERRLKQLQERATDSEKEELEDSIKRLEKDVAKREERHWRDAASQIEWKLNFMALAMHEGVAAALAFDLESDPQVAKAKEVLETAGHYEEVFNKPSVGGAAAAAEETD